LHADALEHSELRADGGAWPPVVQAAADKLRRWIETSPTQREQLQHELPKEAFAF